MKQQAVTLVKLQLHVGHVTWRTVNSLNENMDNFR